MSFSSVSASTPSANALNPATHSPGLFPPSETYLLPLQLSPTDPFSGHLSEIPPPIYPFDATLLFNPIGHESPSPLNPSQISTAEEWHEWAPTPPPEFISTAEQVAQIASTSPIVQSPISPSPDLSAPPLAALDVHPHAHPHAHPTSSAIAMPNPSSDLAEPNLLTTASIRSNSPVPLVNTSSDFLTASLSSMSASSSSSSSSSSAVSSSQNQEVGPAFYGSTFLPSSMPGSQFAAPLPFGFSPFNPYPYPATSTLMPITSFIPTYTPMFAPPLIYSNYFGTPTLGCFPLNNAMPPQAPYYGAASLLPSMAHSSQPLPTASSSSSAEALAPEPHSSHKRKAESSSSKSRASKKIRPSYEGRKKAIEESMRPRIRFIEKLFEKIQSNSQNLNETQSSFVLKFICSSLVDPPLVNAAEVLEEFIKLINRWSREEARSCLSSLFKEWARSRKYPLQYIILRGSFKWSNFCTDIIFRYSPSEVFATTNASDRELFVGHFQEMLKESPEIYRFIKNRVGH